MYESQAMTLKHVLRHIGHGEPFFWYNNIKDTVRPSNIQLQWIACTAFLDYSVLPTTCAWDERSSIIIIIATSFISWWPTKEQLILRYRNPHS